MNDFAENSQNKMNDFVDLKKETDQNGPSLYSHL